MQRSEIDAIPIAGDVSFRQRPVEPERTALLVIDLQKGEYSAEKAAAADPAHRYLLERIRDLVIPNGQKLLAARAKRPRPQLDDKILTAWNGLMIAAFARAARTLVDRPSSQRYLGAAERAATFVRERLWRADQQQLLRRFRDGESAIDAYAEDYAYLVFGLAELFQADGNPEWLRWAIELQARQDALFWDDTHGGWFSTTGTDPTVLLRMKEDYDGAEPAPSSVSVLNLIALHHMGADVPLARAERTLARYGPRIGSAARVVPMMLAALSAWHAGGSQVVIVGNPDSQAAIDLRIEQAKRYRPFTTTVLAAPRRQADLARLLPFVAAMTERDDHPTAYVCRDFACSAPVTTADALAAQL